MNFIYSCNILGLHSWPYSKMRWKILHSALVFYILVHFALCKPVDRRGPPHPDPVEEGSKVEEDLVITYTNTYSSGKARIGRDD